MSESKNEKARINGENNFNQEDNDHSPVSIKVKLRIHNAQETYLFVSNL